MPVKIARSPTQVAAFGAHWTASDRSELANRDDEPYPATGAVIHSQAGCVRPLDFILGNVPAMDNTS